MVNRCLTPTYFGRIASCQLQHFSDASLKAYCEVSCVRMVDEDERIHSTFPIEKLRAELLITMTITRFDQIQRRELVSPVEDSIFWTNCTSVFQYVENQENNSTVASPDTTVSFDDIEFLGYRK